MEKFEEGLGDGSDIDGRSQDPSIILQKATYQIAKLWNNPEINIYFA